MAQAGQIAGPHPAAREQGTQQLQPAAQRCHQLSHQRGRHLTNLGTLRVYSMPTCAPTPAFCKGHDPDGASWHRPRDGLPPRDSLLHGDHLPGPSTREYRLIYSTTYLPLSSNSIYACTSLQPVMTCMPWKNG